MRIETRVSLAGHVGIVAILVWCIAEMSAVRADDGVGRVKSASVARWATATSTRKSDGWAIIYRFALDLQPGFDRATQPDRVIIVWKYSSQQRGMPSHDDRQRMDHLEDSLGSELGEDETFATLAVVTTGDNLREWTYYAQSQEEFMRRLNRAFTNVKPAFPIEVHASPDPKWETYETLRTRINR